MRLLLLGVLTFGISCEHAHRADTADTGADVAAFVPRRSELAAPTHTQATVERPPNASPRRVEPTHSQLDNATVGRLAIPFQENDGQWDGEVAFKADTFAGTLWVTHDGTLVHSLLGPHKEEDASVRAFDSGSAMQTTQANLLPNGADLLQSANTAFATVAAVVVQAPSPLRDPLQDPRGPLHGHAQPREREAGWTLTEHFVGGHPHHPRGIDRAITNVSYFIGNDESKWASHVSTFGAVSLGQVWPGVEVRLVARGNNVEKFFHVAPHGDVAQIEMQLDGALDGAMRLTDSGTLVVSTGHGEIELSAPVAYHIARDGSRRAVTVRYELRGSRYRFVVGEHDVARELVIDPILQSTYLGGSGDEWPYAGILLDAVGNVLVAGYGGSSNYPGTSGGAQASIVAGLDIFISRLNGAMTALLQSTYLGGSGGDGSYGGMTLDGAGNVLVAGYSFSNNYPGTSGAAQASNSGAADIVVSRLNGSLTTLLQSTYVGGSGSEFAHGLTLSGSGDVLVAGRSDSGDYPGTSGGAQANFGGGTLDIVISRLNGSLTALLQSTYLGGSGLDDTFARDITLDGAGNVLIAGRSASSNFPGTSGGAQANNMGAGDIVISKLNGALTALLQSTYLGGSSSESFGGIALDGVGNVLIGGSTYSSDFPRTGGGAQANFGGFQDFVIARLNGALTVLSQSTYLGSFDNDTAGHGGITLDGSGNVLIAGFNASSNFPGTSGGIQANSGGSLDIVITRANGALTAFLQSTYLGGSGSEFSSGGMILDGSGNLLVAGHSTSSNYPGTSGGAQGTFHGSNEIVISRLTGDLRSACLSDVECDDRNACTSDICNVGPGTCAHTNLAAGTSCRAIAGVCDELETCPGAGAQCPTDERRAAGSSCRIAADSCDVAELCDGIADTCPVDVLAPATQVCRAASGVCDIAERCTGTLSACPSDDFLASGTGCPGGICDSSHTCVATSSCVVANCPDDTNPCTVPACVNNACGFAPANQGVACRSAASACDLAEVCDGTTTTCPTDVFAAIGSTCPDGICAAGGQCTANTIAACQEAIDCADDNNPCTSAACVAGNCEQRVGGEGNTCRAKIGECDATETCDGLLAICPADVLVPRESRCTVGVCGNNACVECLLPTHCNDNNPCTDDACGNNICSHAPSAAGIACDTGLSCDGAGACTGCGSNAQCADDNPCTNDACQLGACLHLAYASGFSCASGVCTTTGTLECVECVASTDCQQSYLCRGNHCELDPTADADGDGLSNQQECRMPPNCRDSDRDGTPDFQDRDDDNDGIQTSREAPDARRFGEDFDLDGRANWIDTDADSDGLNDGLDGVDLNRNGRPNYLNPDVTIYQGGLNGGAGNCGCRVQRTAAPTSIGWLLVLAWMLCRHLRRVRERENSAASLRIKSWIPLC